MSECRNCGAEVTIDLGFIGEVAPFFLKRSVERTIPSAGGIRNVKDIFFIEDLRVP